MRTISSDVESNCNSESYSSDQSANIVTKSEKTKLLIQQANRSIKLSSIFRLYKIFPKKSSAEWSEPLRCPFPSHKGGQEKTPSFFFNFQQERFFCHGCGTGGKAVEFITMKDGINPVIVAERLLLEYGSYEIVVDDIDDQTDYEKIEKILFDFSTFLQKIIQSNKNDDNVLNQVDKITWWFDHYLIAKAPQSRVFVDELERRCSKAKELLRKFSNE